MRHPITSPIAVSNAVDRFQNAGEKSEGERKWKNQPLCSCARSAAYPSPLPPLWAMQINDTLSHAVVSAHNGTWRCIKRGKEKRKIIVPKERVVGIRVMLPTHRYPKD